MKPTLYVGLEGPVLIPGSPPAKSFLRSAVADYAKPFMHWATQRFNVRWLTDRTPGEAFHTSKLLGLPDDAVPLSGFEESKTEVIDPHENFYWVDSALIPSEVNWLAQHGHADRFISVDPLYGVKPEHRELLEQLLRSKESK